MSMLHTITTNVHGTNVPAVPVATAPVNAPVAPAQPTHDIIATHY